ncbi:MAG TPA: type II toxin-antitoxin system PemK/MazF family toxin [Tepidisphaeraceae bacterium]|nr:type II toxin-antitoxin system PemK/MazF family toxin [Tepidisphaeraceae bacterium]
MKSGDVVLLDFPFSDLSGSKLRPAVVLTEVGRGDFIACQITSNRDADADAIELTATSFAAGGLRRTSYFRPGKLFTAHRSIVVKVVARLNDVTSKKAKDAVIAIVGRG